MGKVLQESIKKLKEKYSQNGNYSLHLSLGKLSGPYQGDTSEIELHVVFYDVEELEYGKGLKGDSRERLRIAKKLLNHENYRKFSYKDKQVNKIEVLKKQI